LGRPFSFADAMTADEPSALDPDVVWGDDGLPRSGRFGDVYFSSDDGLAETRAVFLAGCGLPDAWAGRSRFVVGELGFGAGLNVAALLQLWARTRLDMGQVFLSPAYFVLLTIGAAFAVFALWTVTDIGLYGGAIYPVTRIMLERLTTSYTVIPLIIAVYYAGELVWRERERKTNELIDASAAPGWAFALPKILAISLVLISTLLAGVLIAVLIQTSKGYHHYDPGRYLLWLVLPQAFDFILLAVLAIFVQILSPNKFLGWAVMIIYLIGQGTAASFGYDHNLYLYGGSPIAPLSDMNGQGRFWVGAWWFRLYWGLFAIALAVLSHAVWQRGVDNRLGPRLRALPRRLAGPPGAILAIALAAFVATGVWIYVNTNIWNDYRTERGDEAWLADYEKALGRYEHTPRPKIVSMKLDVALYPRQPRAVTRGEYVIENRTGANLKEVHFSFDRDLKVTALAVEGGWAVRKQPDPRFNYRIFVLDVPMRPGDRRTVTFTTERSQRGFRNRADEARIVANGAFLDSSELAPVLGFERGALLQDRTKRRERGLPDREPMPPWATSRHGSSIICATTPISLPPISPSAPTPTRRPWRRAG